MIHGLLVVGYGMVKFLDPVIRGLGIQFLRDDDRRNPGLGNLRAGLVNLSRRDNGLRADKHESQNADSSQKQKLRFNPDISD